MKVLKNRKDIVNLQSSKSLIKTLTSDHLGIRQPRGSCNKTLKVSGPSGFRLSMIGMSTVFFVRPDSNVMSVLMLQKSPHDGNVSLNSEQLTPYAVSSSCVVKLTLTGRDVFNPIRLRKRGS